MMSPAPGEESRREAPRQEEISDYPPDFAETLVELQKRRINRALVEDFKIWASGREHFDHHADTRETIYSGWEPEHFKEALRLSEENARERIRSVDPDLRNSRGSLEAVNKAILAEMDTMKNAIAIQERRHAVENAVHLLMNELESAEVHKRARLLEEFRETFGTGHN